MAGERWDEYGWGEEGYREEEEPYVYDQSCENCGIPFCPMKLPETAEEHYERYGTLEDFDTEEARQRLEEVMQMRQEDAEIRNGAPVWCIYWKKKNRRRKR